MKMKSREKGGATFLTRRQTLMGFFNYMIFMHFLKITLYICLPNPSYNHWLILIKTHRQDKVSNAARFVTALQNWSNLAGIHSFWPCWWTQEPLEVTQLHRLFKALVTITGTLSRIWATSGRGCQGHMQQDLVQKRDEGADLWLTKREEWLYGKRIAFCTVVSILWN